MVDACCIFFWLSDAGWIEEDIERKQRGQMTILIVHQEVMRTYLGAVRRRGQTRGPLYR